jgi:glycosyltransferase involved in cell wall biosynthesis
VSEETPEAAGFTLRPSASVTGRALRQAPVVRPLVSVVITNYNYGRYLAEAATSVLTQRDVDVEVVIVDDASTDESLRVAGRLATLDNRVRLLVRDTNGGPVVAFNDGLGAATGQFVVRLDADDMLTPGSLARATALAETFPRVGLVYGHPLHFRTGDLPAARELARKWTVWPGQGWLERRCRLGHNCITSPEILMRTSVLRMVGGMRGLAHSHDLELWLRMARASDVGWVGGADQAWHRVHRESLSARELDVNRDLAERAEAFTTLFTDGQGDSQEDRRLLDIACAALANEAVTRTTQAYSAGRGGSEETASYLEYASSIHRDLAGLPRGKALRHAERLGPSRARYSPYLLALALAHRIALVIAKSRWRLTGV